jgi:hypothetical protein
MRPTGTCEAALYHFVETQGVTRIQPTDIDGGVLLPAPPAGLVFRVGTVGPLFLLLLQGHCYWDDLPIREHFLLNCFISAQPYRKSARLIALS